MKHAPSRPARAVAASLLAVTSLTALVGCSAGPDPDRFQTLWRAVNPALDRLSDDPNSIPGGVAEASAVLALPSRLTVTSWQHAPRAHDGSFCIQDKQAGTYFAVVFHQAPHAAPATVMLGDGPTCSLDPAVASVVSPDYLTFTKGGTLMGNVSRDALGRAALTSITHDAKGIDTAISHTKATTGTYPADIAAVEAQMQALGIALSGHESLRDYRPTDQGTFTFCLLDPTSGAWGYYDSEASNITNSGTGSVVCAPGPLAAPTPDDDIER